MTSVASEITSLKNYTTQLESKTDTVTGIDSENLTQKDFLKLLTQQLQFQDPMEPQGNSEFISQMCQFSQLNVTSEISSTLSEYTGDMKAESLVGQKVTITNPKDTSTTITGQVTSALLDGQNSGITIDGTTYSMDYLLYTYGNSITE